MRLHPGEDPRQQLEALQAERRWPGAAIVSAVGSLRRASIRFADRSRPTSLRGPLEVVSLSGTIGPEGSHLHISVANPRGKTRGGHLSRGSVVYTTLELVILVLDDVALSREEDPETTYKELVPKRIAPRIPL